MTNINCIQVLESLIEILQKGGLPFKISEENETYYATASLHVPDNLNIIIVIRPKEWVIYASLANHNPYNLEYQLKETLKQYKDSGKSSYSNLNLVANKLKAVAYSVIRDRENINNLFAAHLKAEQTEKYLAEEADKIIKKIHKESKFYVRGAEPFADTRALGIEIRNLKIPLDKLEIVLNFLKDNEAKK